MIKVPWDAFDEDDSWDQPHFLIDGMRKLGHSGIHGLQFYSPGYVMIEGNVIS